MKKINSLLIIVLIVSMLYSCSNNPQEMIIGSWKIKSIESSAKMNDVEKQMFTEANEDLTANESYEFSASKLIVKYGEIKNDATWELSEDGKNLSFVLADGKDYIYQIVEMSSNKMVWKTNIDNSYDITTTLEKK